MKRLGAVVVLALASVGCVGCGKGCGQDAPSVDRSVRVQVYVVDETTRAFAGREKDAPFPALPDGTDLQIPREHEATLARFIATVTPPAGARLLVGEREAGDSFARTFLVVTPPAIDEAHVGRVNVTESNGARGVGFAVDDTGRASIAAIAGKRIAIVVDGRVVLSSYRPTFGTLPATTSAKK